MAEQGEDTHRVEKPNLPRCPECNAVVAPSQTRCDRCGCPVTPLHQAAAALPIDRAPTPWPVEPQGHDVLKPHASVILQFLPSGFCMTLPLHKPLLLGRELILDMEGDVLDLSAYNAVQHGVSRHHCQLYRRGVQLVVTDLGSTNGTFLNGDELLPHRDYVVAHNDKLILGTLHLIVSFSAL